MCLRYSSSCCILAHYKASDDNLGLQAAVTQTLQWALTNSDDWNSPLYTEELCRPREGLKTLHSAARNETRWITPIGGPPLPSASEFMYTRQKRLGVWREYGDHFCTYKQFASTWLVTSILEVSVSSKSTA